MQRYREFVPTVFEPYGFVLCNTSNNVLNKAAYTIQYNISMESEFIVNKETVFKKWVIFVKAKNQYSRFFKP